jgi:glyoxylase-like metal-dependent hydrolase (beta-lactamase superfamily II)
VTTSTSQAVSADSGLPWAEEGAWEVAPGLHRIPLPLPTDGLRAVNVYVLSAGDGLVLVDGGWAIPEAREVFARSLQSIGAGFGDIRSFLVTHMHRDHYSMARTLGTELGIPVALGREERPGLDALLAQGDAEPSPFVAHLDACGAPGLAREWAKHFPPSDRVSPWWRYPDSWLTDGPVVAGGRTLEAIHTPGHTPGHYVFADHDAGLLFAGDHVLPTITPSIGFVYPVPANPLADFMLSLARVRALPDLRVLPAHGPLAPSSHARADELLAHHEDRLELCLQTLHAVTRTAAEVAAELPWTRRHRAYAELDSFNQGMAVMETRAHLEVLVSRGRVTVTTPADGPVSFAAASPGGRSGVSG